MLDERMIWTDIETFGLVPEESPILEVGFVITDLQLNLIDEWDVRIWDTPSYDQRFEFMLKESAHDESENYVLNMHNSSGLWKACQQDGFSLKEAGNEISDWLDSHGIKEGREPMCGSSVHFDNQHISYWWPEVGKRFSYRIVDVSSLKMLCAAYLPGTFSALPASNTQHRALSDCHDTINEFKFYKEYLLHV
jgi:oligoribonuclease